MPIFLLWCSILNNSIMNSLIDFTKDFLLLFFTMSPFYTSWNYEGNVWFSDIFKECKTSENLGSCIVSREYKIETLERNGWNYKLFILIRKFKNRLFQGSTFSKCFQILKRLQGNPFGIPRIHKQTNIGIQIKTLQT